MNGGKTRTIEARTNNVRDINTIISESALGILNIFFTLLHKLHMTLAITSEHIISNRKSLRLQNIKKPIINIENFK